MSDKIKKFPGSFKSRPGGVATIKLECIPLEACDHGWGVEFIVREDTGEVACGCCNANLDAMWVLRKIAPFLDEMKKKQRAKCRHCGRMTQLP